MGFLIDLCDPNLNNMFTCMGMMSFSAISSTNQLMVVRRVIMGFMGTLNSYFNSIFERHTVTSFLIVGELNELSTHFTRYVW